MESKDIRQARQALAGIPGLGAEAAPTARIARLKGLTNLVYRIEAGGERFCLRLPGPGSADIIDRQAEAANARAAAAAGIAPALLYFGEDGLMLTRFVDDAVTLSPERFRESPEAVERAALALRCLHDRAEDFSRDFNVFAILDDYAGLLERRGADLPEDCRLALAEVEEVREALAARPMPSKPCHCDPTGANLLDTGTRIWIVDWEYSGQNDPMWDLAYLSAEGELDAGLDRRLLRAYFERPAQDAELGRLMLYKPLCELLSALWALVQASGGNRAADFRAYAEATLARCRERLRSPDFARHLDAVRRG